jgi:hypothetical protein
MDSRIVQLLARSATALHPEDLHGPGEFACMYLPEDGRERNKLGMDADGKLWGRRVCLKSGMLQRFELSSGVLGNKFIAVFRGVGGA